MRNSYYPVFLKISGRRCVVVGGGRVALRKAKALLEHGANVEVVSADLCPELDELAGKGEIQAVRRNYRPGDLAGAAIAIAATDDPRTNLRVSKEGRKTGALVNVVDDADSSDFIVPSYLRRGDVAVAISTGGRSPALARKIRTALDEHFGEGYAGLASLVEDVRAEVRRRGIKVSAEDWQKALDLDTLTGLLKKGDVEKARVLLLSRLNVDPG